MSRQRMSTVSGSRSPSVVTSSRSSGPPTSRPTTTACVGRAVLEQHLSGPRPAGAAGPSTAGCRSRSPGRPAAACRSRSSDDVPRLGPVGQRYHREVVPQRRAHPRRRPPAPRSCPGAPAPARRRTPAALPPRAPRRPSRRRRGRRWRRRRPAGPRGPGRSASAARSASTRLSLACRVCRGLARHPVEVGRRSRPGRRRRRARRPSRASVQARAAGPEADHDDSPAVRRRLLGRPGADVGGDGLGQQGEGEVRHRRPGRRRPAAPALAGRWSRARRRAPRSSTPAASNASRTAGKVRPSFMHRRRVGGGQPLGQLLGGQRAGQHGEDLVALDQRPRRPPRRPPRSREVTPGTTSVGYRCASRLCMCM